MPRIEFRNGELTTESTEGHEEAVAVIRSAISVFVNSVRTLFNHEASNERTIENHDEMEGI